MKKYLPVFSISFQQEFSYKINFIMWRLRNILQIIAIFYLWDSVFAGPQKILFGYDKGKIITYVFGILLLKPLVTAARSVDIPGEIADGRYTNYLLKPLNYFKYWFTRDLATKTLNLVFAIGEFSILFILIKPAFFFQTNFLIILAFVVSLILAILLYFLLLLLFSTFVMWFPENAWGAMFLLGIFVEFMGGAIFPLDILPSTIANILYATPFPYLFFLPLQIYLGKVTNSQLLFSIFIPFVWSLILIFVVKNLWNRGMKVYEAQGK